MTIKKIFSIALCTIIILLPTACHKNSTANIPSKQSSFESGETFLFTEEESGTEETSTDSDSTSTSAENKSNETTTSAKTTAYIGNPADWSKAEIVEIYKKAAENTHKSAKCDQVITLKDISINNGQFKTGIKFVKSVVSTFLKNNSTEISGITGGYSNLVESDVLKAKAYPVGSNTAIEMVMVEQVAGPYENALDGTVGHAVSVVGDISVVTTQLTDLGIPLEISEKDTKIYYTNPVVKVLIDSNGNIVKGTWGYTVDIRLNNYVVTGTKINTTSVVMDNTIRLNGGFDG